MAYFLLISVSVLNLFAADDLTESKLRGKAYFETNCINCHGPIGVAMATPNLYGQFRNYIVKALSEFKSETRRDNIMSFMNFITKDMSTDNIVDVANYLSELDPCANDIELDTLGGDVARGKQLVKRNFCTSCHSEKEGSFGPKIAGQKSSYIKASIEAFKAKTRENANMYGLIQHFEDADITNIAAYMNSLRNCKSNDEVVIP